MPTLRLLPTFLARFQRLDGKDVFFLSGTDEHGQKMQQTAAKEGLSPIELADRNSAVFRKMLEVLNCSNDDFIRTTEQRHRVSVQHLWEKMQANGDIYLDTYGGWYSVRQEAYFDEAETVLGEDGIRTRASWFACRMGRGGKLLFPPLCLWRETVGALRTEPGVRCSARAAQ